MSIVRTDELQRIVDGPFPILCQGYTTEVVAVEDRVIAVVQRECMRHARPIPAQLELNNGTFDMVYFCTKHHPMFEYEQFEVEPNE